MFFARLEATGYVIGQIDQSRAEIRLQRYDLNGRAVPHSNPPCCRRPQKQIVIGPIAIAHGFGGLQIAVANVDGRYYAFDDTCTHELCSLAEGFLDDVTVTCPCNCGQFDVTTGDAVAPPVFELPRGAVIEVANLRRDDMLADNTAHAVVPPAKRLRVALVAPKSFILRSAMEGMALERLEILSADRFDMLAEEGRLDAFDVIVLDNHRPHARIVELPAGRYLTFGATPPLMSPAV